MGIQRQLMGRWARAGVLAAGIFVFGPVLWGQQADIAGPSALGRCEQATFTITVVNTHPTHPMSTIVVTNTRPNSGFSYVPGTSVIRLHDGSTFNADPAQSGLDLIWDIDHIAGSPYDLPPGETVTIEFDLATSCATISGTDSVRVDYSLDGNPQYITDSLSIEILPGAVVIYKEPAVISARVGEEVVWTIAVENTGLGPIYSVVVTDVLGSGLAYVSSSPPGMNVGQTTTWEIAEILPGDTVEIEITARVIACAGLENKADVRFGCGGETCFDTTVHGGTATASILLVLGQPLLQFTPPTIAIPYCTITGTEITMPITNTGDGTAHDVKICVNMSPLQVSNVQGGASYDGSCFFLPNVAPGETFDLTFDVSYSGWCAGSPSGTLFYESVYDNDCGEEFRPPLSFGTYSTSYAPDGAPSLSASISSVSGSNEVQICTEVSYQVSVSFSGLSSCGGGTTSDIEATLVIPDGFTVEDDGGGTWTPGPGGTGGAITWTIPPDSPLDTPIALRSPGAVRCGQVATLALTAIATNCCGCALSATSSVPVAIECRALVNTQRAAAPSIQEKCDVIVYTNTYTFADSDALDDVGFDELTFVEYANNNQAYVPGSLVITVDGNPASAMATSDTTPGGTLDILGIDYPGSVRGHVLVISYGLEVTPDSLPSSCPGSHSFYAWSSLNLGPDCATGDECTDYCEKSEATLVQVATPAMSVSVAGLPSMIDLCGTYTVTITLTKTSAAPPRNARLVLENLNYYIVDLGTVVCSGDVAPISCAPNDLGTAYEWIYEDRFETATEGARSVITAQVRKRCGPGMDLTATAWFDDACDGTCSVSGSGNPSYLRTPSLFIYKTPEVVYATRDQVSWTIYVVNSGSGWAYDVWVDDVMGIGLEYVSSTVTPVGGVTTHPNEDHLGGPINGVSWRIAAMAPGEQRVIVLVARLVGCADLTNEVWTSCGCGGEDCLPEVGDDSYVLIPPTNVVATSLTASPINTCAIQPATIRIRNAGDPAVYDLEARETLPAGLVYVGPTRWRVGSGPWTAGSDPTEIGNTLIWTVDEIAGLAELRSRQTLEIEFGVRALCDFNGGNLEVSVDYSSVCGDPGSVPVGAFRLDARRPSLSVNKVQVSPTGSIDCGGDVTWRIDVTNTGQIAIPYVWVEDELGTGLVYVSSTGDGVYSVDNGCNFGPVTTWAIQNLLPGAIARLYLTARSADAGQLGCTDLQNTVWSWWGCGSDLDGSSCTEDGDCLTAVPATKTVQGSRTPTVSLTTSLDPISIGSCGETTFNLTIRNTSTAAANSIDARVLLPTGLSYVSGSTEIDCGAGFAPTPDDPVLSGSYLFWYDATNLGLNLCDEIPAGGAVALRFKLQASCYVSAQNVSTTVYYYDCCLTTQRTASASRSVPAATPNLTVSVLPSTVPLDCYDLGDEVTWTITVRNTGSGAADWAQVESTLGSSLQWVAGGTMLGGNPQRWGWEFGPLGPGDSESVDLTAWLLPPGSCDQALRTFTSQATWGCGDFDGDPNTTAEYTCQRGTWVAGSALALVPNLAINPAELTISCNGDDTFSIEAVVRNLGDAPAANASIRIYADGTRIHEEWHDIPAGDSYRVQFTTPPLACGTGHVFRVAGDEDDVICECNEGNNETQATASCPCPGLVTGKAITEVRRQGTPVPTNSPIQPGDVITYTLTVRNVGLGRAFNVEITDEVPVEFEYVTGSTTGTWPGESSTADPSGIPGPNLVWDLSADLGHNETLVLAYRVEVTSLIRESQVYTNTMRATGEEGDGTPIPPDSSSLVPGDDDPDDSSSVSHPAAVPALSVNKMIVNVLRGGANRGPAGPVEPGDVIVYEFLIRNVGDGTAYNVDFTDELPFGVEYDTSFGDGTYTVDNPPAFGTMGIADGATGTIFAGISAQVAGGGTLTAIYRVRVTSAVSQGTDLVNIAAATGEDGAGTPIPPLNPDLGDTSDDDPDDPDPDDTGLAVIGAAEPGLALTKEIVDVLRGGSTIWPTPIVLWGDVLVYRVTVRNVGLGTAYNADLTDELPVGLAYDTAFGDGTYTVDDPLAGPLSLGIPDGATGLVIANISAQVNAGGTLVATYRARVTPEAVPGSYLVNHAVVTGEDGAGTPIPEFNPDVGDDLQDQDVTTIRVGAPALVTKKDVFCDACPCLPPPAPCDPCVTEPVPVTVGSRVTFKLIVKNVGYSRAYDVVVEDRLPPGFAYIAETSRATWPGGESEAEPAGAPGPLLTWFTGASLDAGETLTVTFDTVVTSEAPLGEEIRNTMWAGAVDDFNVPIPADSSMFVPADDDPDDMSTLTLIVRPAPAGAFPAPDGEGGISTARAAGGWAALGVAALAGGLAFRLRWPRGKASRGLWIGLFLILALTGLGFMAAGAEHTIIALSGPLKGGILFGAGIYEAGETVQLTTLPNVGFEFVGWFEDGVETSTLPVLEFLVDRDRTLVARFRPTLDFVGVTRLSRGSLTLLPSLALQSHRVEFRPRFLFGAFPWDLRLVAAFTGAEWKDAQAHFTGSWETIRLGAGLLFNPLVPEYRSAYFMASWPWGDLRIGLRVTHYPRSGTPPAPYLLYNLSLSTSDLSVTVRAEERDGLQFKDLTVYMYGVELCCGIEAQGTLSFTKQGFAYAQASLQGVPGWCCGLSLDIAVTFKPDGKELDLTPRWTPHCDSCLTLYGDVLWENGTWQGLALYGYKIRCCIGGCCPGGSGSYVEFVTAFDPAMVPGGFQGDEFEYVKWGFCGPGCCGGSYLLEMTAYFVPAGSLFGLSRVTVSSAVPLSAALRVDATLEIGTTDTPAKLIVGWQWKF